ncbi:MAG TPA: alpha/beta hydrolase [Candidatus Binatia bacterium]|nr:alpha/beta hydrolase [Candidatus Binatia bacterium]
MRPETKILETNGGRIAYDVEGAGEAVVLIHAGVADRRMWDDQVAALRDAYRVIRYDTRGFGETETDAVPFSNRADLAALLDHLGERSAHLVGLSRAGSIALDFSIEFPDRVRSLVVAAGGVSGYDPGDEARPRPAGRRSRPGRRLASGRSSPTGRPRTGPTGRGSLRAASGRPSATGSTTGSCPTTGPRKSRASRRCSTRPRPDGSAT